VGRVITVRDISHVIYQVTDLDKTEAFLANFGLVKASRTSQALYMRASEASPYVHVSVLGPEPKFLGVAFKVDSLDDLERASAIPHASAIEPLDAPGGGEVVRLRGPDGYRIDLVFGQAPVDALPIEKGRTYNSADNLARANLTQRIKPGRGDVVRISHVALYVSDAGAAAEWFKTTLGLVPSDYVTTPDGTGIGACFMRANKGMTPTDHHTLAVSSDPQKTIHHCSFWVQDLDSLANSHFWMKQQGMRHEHGIGRHYLGSQVFDYWRDPDGFMIERFTDGDVFDCTVPASTHPFSWDIFFQWGPPAAPSFNISVLKD
jgi:catechol 2,3-dioxygenase-like lactoylglutathione lyase family enzyme